MFLKDTTLSTDSAGPQGHKFNIPILEILD